MCELNLWAGVSDAETRALLEPHLVYHIELNIKAELLHIAEPRGVGGAVLE